MPPILSSSERAGAALGIARGANILAFFGFVWFGWGFGSVPGFPIAGWLAFYAAVIALGIFAVRTLLHAKGLAAQQIVERAGFQRQHGRRFLLITILEFAGCGLVAALATHFHRPELIAPGIALVVGLHFFPLATLFRFPMYHAVGAAMMLCAILGVVVFRGDSIAAATGISCGTVLWMAALHSLQRSHKLAPNLRG
jgi:hypothetical protein